MPRSSACDPGRRTSRARCIDLVPGEVDEGAGDAEHARDDDVDHTPAWSDTPSGLSEGCDGCVHRRALSIVRARVWLARECDNPESRSASLRWHDPDQLRRSKLGEAPSQTGITALPCSVSVQRRAWGRSRARPGRSQLSTRVGSQSSAYWRHPVHILPCVTPAESVDSFW